MDMPIRLRLGKVISSGKLPSMWCINISISIRVRSYRKGYCCSNVSIQLVSPFLFQGRDKVWVVIMKFNRSTIVANTSLLLASSVQATIFLAPEQDILLPSSESAINPLAYLGANSPYFAGKLLDFSSFDY